jgi:hypothetical protein
LRLFHRDAQHAVLHRRADRVGTAHVLATQFGAQCQVLALFEAELIAQRLGHGERDGHGVASFAHDAEYGQRMEFAHRNSERLSAA